MAGLLRRIPGLAIAATLAIAVLPSTTVPVAAATFNFPGQTCSTMNGQSGSEMDNNAVTYNDYHYAVTLEPGESLSVQFTPLGAGDAAAVEVNGLDHPTTIGPFSTQVTFVLSIFVHETSFVITSSCAATQPQPQSNAEAAAAAVDALSRLLGGARPSSNPNSLPGSRDEDPCGALRRDVAALKAAILREESRIDDVEDRKAILEFDLGDPEVNQFDLVGRIRAINIQLATALDNLESLQDDLSASERALDECEARARGDGDDGDLGDGEEVLFFPPPDSHVPWPIVPSGGAIPAHAYAGNGLDLGSDRFFDLDGMPANFWTRFRGNVLDGTFGRTGIAGSLQAGVTVGVSDDVDLGVYAYLLTGQISSTPLSGELKTLAAALGAYVKKHLDNGMTLGLSASQEFSANDITLSGATGSFTSSLTTLDASVAFAPIQLDGFVLTPSAAAGWKHTVNGGYTDSTGLVVPSTTNTTLAATGALGVAYPIAIENERIATVTPRASVAGSLFLLPGSSLALTPGTLSPSHFTLDASAGLSLGLVSGGTVDVAVTANGLLGQSQAYGVRAGLRVPL